MRTSGFVLLIVMLLLPCVQQDVSAQAKRTGKWSPERGMLQIDNISTRVTGSAETSFDCDWDERGVLWVANVYGLLEFDGASWRTHPSITNMPLFSVACGRDGDVYFGSTAAFGRLRLTPEGRYVAEVLSDSLPNNAAKLSQADQIHLLGDDVWFCTENMLIRWDGRYCSYILPQTAFGKAFSVRDELYVWQDSLGLCVVRKNQAVPLRGTESLVTIYDTPLFLQPLGSGDLVLGMKRKGVFRYDGKRFSRLFEYEPMLGARFLPRCGMRLSDGSYALGTNRDGVFILDQNGRLRTVINTSTGLAANSIAAVKQDKEGDLWLILDDGIARIEWPAATTVFNDANGVSGKIAAMARFMGRLYMATTTGFYVLKPEVSDPRGRFLEMPHFEPVTGLPSIAYDLLELENELLIGTAQGVQAMQRDGTLSRVSTLPSRKLLRLNGRSDTIVVSSDRGLHLLIARGRGSWEVKRIFPDMQNWVLSLSQTADGTVYATTVYYEMLCITPPRGTKPETMLRFDTADGLPTTVMTVANVFEEPIIITEDVTMTFDREQRRVMEATEFLSRFEPPLRGMREPAFLHVDGEGSVIMQIFTEDLGRVTRGKNDRLRFRSIPYSRAARDRLFCAFLDDDGVCWFGADGRIARVDPSVPHNYQRPIRTVIRSVTVDRDTLYRGNTPLDPARVLEIKPHQDYLAIECATLSFELMARTYFRYMLEGHDTTWAMMPNGGRVEYRQLPAGDYRFRIQAIKGDQLRGTEAVIPISVLLPWYREWWAIALYVLVIGLVGYGGRLWYRSRFLVARSMELEDLVKARTREIQAQAREIRRQAEELERLDSIVRTVNRETQLPEVLDALLMQSLLLFPHADVALFVRREVHGDRFRVVAAVGRNANDLKERTFSFRELVGSADTSLQRMREGVYLLHGIGTQYAQGGNGFQHTHYMAMAIERARMLEGFLVLGSTREDTFGESDLHRLMRLKEHASSAIAKAGAIDELERKNTELDTTNRRLVETQRQLVAHEKLAALGELTAGIAHEIQNPLNFVNNFSELSCELLGELEQALHRDPEIPDPQTARLIDLIRSNCNHIREHGRRATSIVSAMIMHSRSGISQRSTVVLNDMVDEFVMLAYHGMRLQFPQFVLDLKRDYDPDVGEVEVLPQDLSRAIVNVCNNAWEAAINRAAEQGGGFVPSVQVSSERDGDAVHICVVDNGHGIPEELREKIFEPFFTTRRTSRNAGLGLSLSYDIITQLHGGKLTVHSEPGAQTEFRITLPRTLPS